MTQAKQKNRAYYDEFSAWYENERHRGYHAMLDDLEVDLLCEYARDADVLEIGCGTGLILDRVKDVSKSAVGVDLGVGMLRGALERGLDVAQADATALPFADESFDVVYSFKVLAHIEDIGTALAEPGRHNILPPREAVGGTMDIRDLSRGTVLFLPVRVAGALLSMGDPHAAQGEGEVCGTGVESPIDVSARIELVKGAAPSAPRFTTPGSTTDHLSGAGYEVTTGIGPDLLENARAALRRMVELVSAEQNLAPIDVYLLCSACADMRLSQVVDDPNWIVSCYFPRIVFEYE